MLRAAIRHDDPVLVYEHKGLYGRKGPVSRGDAGIAEIGKGAIVRAGRRRHDRRDAPDGRPRAREPPTSSRREGIDAEVIDLRWLRPLDLPLVRASVEKTGRLVIAEEQVHAGGWGATLISRLDHRRRPPGGSAAGRRAAGRPADPLQPPLEDAIIPDAAAIARAVRSLPA